MIFKCICIDRFRPNFRTRPRGGNVEVPRNCTVYVPVRVIPMENPDLFFVTTVLI